MPPLKEPTGTAAAPGRAADDVIEEIEMIPIGIRLEPGRGYGSAREIARRRAATIVRIRLRCGIVGIGESFGPPELNLAYLPMLREVYVGKRAVDHRWLWRRMTDSFYHVRAQSQLAAAMSGIDIAIHDAMGKITGLPLYRLLGGEPCDSLPVYASGGYFNEAQAAGLESQLEAVAGEFGAYKIKVGRGTREDAARASTARRIIGDDAMLMVDINGAYLLDDALASIAAMAPADIYWVEEPLAPDDLDGYRRLAGRSAIRIAAGETCVTAHEFLRLVETGSVDVLMPDLNMCGGFVEGLRVADMAQLAGIKVSPHVWGSAVGFAAALHFAAAMPTSPHISRTLSEPLVEYDVSDNPLSSEILAEPLRIAGGRAELPPGSGLGVALDEQAIGRLRLE